MARPTENVVAFYNKRGTCEQWIKEGKGAIRWPTLSCRSFAANAVQLRALAYNLDNFLRTLATPEPIKDGSLTSLKEKLIKIGAKVVSHGRYLAFQMAEVAIPRNLFADIRGSSPSCGCPPGSIDRLSCSPVMRSLETHKETSALMTENSPRFCSLQGAGARRTPSIAHNNSSLLQKAPNGKKLSITEGRIRRISDQSGPIGRTP
jgi:hypothetical protein